MDCNIKRVLKRFCLWKLTVLDSCFLPNAEKKHCKEGQKSITLSSLKRFVSYHQITILEWFSHGMSSAWFPWPQNVRHQNQKWNHFVNSPKNNSAAAPSPVTLNATCFTLLLPSSHKIASVAATEPQTFTSPTCWSNAATRISRPPASRQGMVPWRSGWYWNATWS